MLKSVQCMNVVCDNVKQSRCGCLGAEVFCAIESKLLLVQTAIICRSF
jgi:hypothetical protein